jgi:hypothetical protein
VSKRRIRRKNTRKQPRRSRRRDPNRTGNGGVRPPLETRWQKGYCPNPKGRPPLPDEFRKRCASLVDELVIHAWQHEVATKGKHWIRASELLAYYGKGKPKLEVELTGKATVTVDWKTQRDKFLDRFARAVGAQSPIAGERPTLGAGTPAV